MVIELPALDTISGAPLITVFSMDSTQITLQSGTSDPITHQGTTNTNDLENTGETGAMITVMPTKKGLGWLAINGMSLDNFAHSSGK